MLLSSYINILTKNENKDIVFWIGTQLNFTNWDKNVDTRWMKIISIAYKTSYWFCMATELTCKLSKWSEYRMEFRASNKCLINIFGRLRSLDAMLRRCDMQQNGIAESTSWCGDFQNAVQVLLGMRFIENNVILLLLSKISQNDVTLLNILMKNNENIVQQYSIPWVWIVQVS